MSARCGFSDLLVDQCACSHCRPDLTPNTTANVEVAYQFTASFPGHCANCRKPTDAGDLIARTTDGEYVCLECAT